MRIFQLIPIALVSLLCLACNKEEVSQTVIGKWQFSESRSGLNQEWQPANPDYKDVMEFRADGSFTQTFEPLHENPPCVGTYQLLGNDEMLLTISCQAYPVTWVYVLDEESLTFQFQGREDAEYFRYVRIA